MKPYVRAAVYIWSALWIKCCMNTRGFKPHLLRTNIETAIKTLSFSLKRCIWSFMYTNELSKTLSLNNTWEQFMRKISSSPLGNRFIHNHIWKNCLFSFCGSFLSLTFLLSKVLQSFPLKSIPFSSLFILLSVHFSATYFQ